MSITKFTVCLSVNDNYAYYKNAPLVYKAWKYFFPECQVALGYVCPKNNPKVRKSDVAVKDFLSQNCDILFCADEMGGIPTENQAKFLRYYIASSLPEDTICLIHDIDSIPLQRAYWTSHVFKNYKDNKLLAVGHDVYEGTEHQGKFPASNMMGTPKIFKRLINPNSKSYNALLFDYCGIREFDDKERLDQIKNIFSDESLIRYCVVKNLGLSNVEPVNRNINIERQWLDRSWWSFDLDRIKNGNIIEANLPREFDLGSDQVDYSQLEDYITKCYKKMKQHGK